MGHFIWNRKQESTICFVRNSWCLYLILFSTIFTLNPEWNSMKFLVSDSNRYKISKFWLYRRHGYIAERPTKLCPGCPHFACTCADVCEQLDGIHQRVYADTRLQTFGQKQYPPTCTYRCVLECAWICVCECYVCIVIRYSVQNTGLLKQHAIGIGTPPGFYMANWLSLCRATRWYIQSWTCMSSAMDRKIVRSTPSVVTGFILSSFL